MNQELKMDLSVILRQYFVMSEQVEEQVINELIALIKVWETEHIAIEGETL